MNVLPLSHVPDRKNFFLPLCLPYVYVAQKGKAALESEKIRGLLEGLHTANIYFPETVRNKPLQFMVEVTTKNI